MNCYVFSHRQYGKLRIVLKDGKTYYFLKDLIRIFSKTERGMFKIIANSEGEIKIYNFMMEAPKAAKENFLSEEEMEVVGKRISRTQFTDQVFVDDIFLGDMEANPCDNQKLAAKWIHGYVGQVIQQPNYLTLFKAHGVLHWGDYGLLEPLDISYDGIHLYINRMKMSCI